MGPCVSMRPAGRPMAASWGSTRGPRFPSRNVCVFPGVARNFAITKKENFLFGALAGELPKKRKFLFLGRNEERAPRFSWQFFLEIAGIFGQIRLDFYQKTPENSPGFVRKLLEISARVCWKMPRKSLRKPGHFLVGFAGKTSAHQQQLRARHASDV